MPRLPFYLNWNAYTNLDDQPKFSRSFSKQKKYEKKKNIINHQTQLTHFNCLVLTARAANNCAEIIL